MLGIFLPSANTRQPRQIWSKSGLFTTLCYISMANAQTTGFNIGPTKEFLQPLCRQRLSVGTVRQFFMVKAQQMQDIVVPVVGVHSAFGAQFVGQSVVESAFDTSTSPLSCITSIVMPSTATPVRRATEFASPDNERVSQEVTLFAV